MSLQVTTTDSRKRARQLSIDGFVKPSGKVAAKVTTDKGDEYFVNGEQCSCPSHKRCYHLNAVERIAFLLPTCEEIEQAAALETYDVVAEAIAVVANAEAELDAAMYETLATTKKVSVPAEYNSCSLCGCRIADGETFCKRC